MKYKAQERQWVKRLLARLTPEQRQRYELACRDHPVRHHNSGKLYDGEKAKIAERILYEDLVRHPAGGEGGAQPEQARRPETQR